MEGADNINYEIVKKWIDKICLKDSTERLNQPGKIAMIYEDAAIKAEFLPCLRFECRTLKPMHISCPENPVTIGDHIRKSEWNRMVKEQSRW